MQANSAAREQQHATDTLGLAMRMRAQYIFIHQLSLTEKLFINGVQKSLN